MPLILFALPDPKAETNHFEIAVPHLGSLILTHEWDGEIKGLKSFPPEDRPNPIIPFFAFRIMVGIGMIMIAVGVSRLGACGSPGACTRAAGSCAP